MSITSIPRAIVALTLGFVAMSHPSHAADDSSDPVIPEDVSSFFGDEAMEAIAPGGEAIVAGPDMTERGAQDGNPPDLSVVTHLGPIHEVVGWSKSFATAETTESPVERWEEWIAPMLTTDGVSIGVMTTWRNDGDVEWAGLSTNSALGDALARLPESALVVHSPEAEQWFALDNSTLAALNTNAEVEVPTPLPIAEYQRIYAARLSASIAQAQSVVPATEGPPALDAVVGGSAPLIDNRAWWQVPADIVIVAAAAVALGGGGIVCITLLRARRHRRDERDLTSE